MFGSLNAIRYGGEKKVIGLTSNLINRRDDYIYFAKKYLKKTIVTPQLKVYVRQKEIKLFFRIRNPPIWSIHTLQHSFPYIRTALIHLGLVVLQTTPKCTKYFHTSRSSNQIGKLLDGSSILNTRNIIG